MTLSMSDARRIVTDAELEDGELIVSFMENQEHEIQRLRSIANAIVTSAYEMAIEELDANPTAEPALEKEYGLDVRAQLKEGLDSVLAIINGEK